MNEEDAPMGFILPNRAYDIVNWLVTVVMPAFATLYFALAKVWGWSYAEAVVATIAALVAFFGVVLRLSSAKYKAKQMASSDGALELGSNEDGNYIRFVSNMTPEELAAKDKVSFKVLREEK